MKNYKCKNFQEYLTLAKMLKLLNGVLNRNCYLNKIDRGCLKYLSDFVLGILIEPFKMF